jgi:competence protein ComEA
MQNVEVMNRMKRLLDWIRERLLVLLSVLVILQSGVIAWLAFQPDAVEPEWRVVNEQMEDALEQTTQQDSEQSEGTREKQADGTDKDSSSSDADQSTDNVAADDATRAEMQWPLDLNKATLEQLDQLPGIGPSKAQAILDYRQQIGTFASVDQLLDVKGIGEKTLRSFRTKVTVEK